MEKSNTQNTQNTQDILIITKKNYDKILFRIVDPKYVDTTKFKFEMKKRIDPSMTVKEYLGEREGKDGGLIGMFNINGIPNFEILYNYYIRFKYGKDYENEQSGMTKIPIILDISDTSKYAQTYKFNTFNEKFPDQNIHYYDMKDEFYEETKTTMEMKNAFEFESEDTQKTGNIYQNIGEYNLIANKDEYVPCKILNYITKKNKKDAIQCDDINYKYLYSLMYGIKNIRNDLELEFKAFIIIDLFKKKNLEFFNLIILH